MTSAGMAATCATYNSNLRVVWGSGHGHFPHNSKTSEPGLYLDKKRCLSLNAETKVQLVGSKQNLNEPHCEDLSLTIKLETVQISNVIQDLGVWLES